MTSTPPHRRDRRGPAARLARAVGVASVAALAAASPASALNFVTNTNGDSWGVADSAAPGVDTGSIRNTSTGSLQGFGGLRVQTVGASKASPYEGALLRGFDIKFDGVNRFDSKHAVELGGIHVTRSLLINRQDSWARFFDSFTNRGAAPVTIEVAFGGQLGYGTGFNQTEIATTGSGDTAITPADSYVVVKSPNASGASNNGPAAIVLGEPGAGNLTRTGDFLVDPFGTPLASAGEHANHHGYVNRLTLAPNETASLARFVATGLSEARPLNGVPAPAAGTQVTAVTNRAATLATDPSLGDLTTAELCTLKNWDVSALTISGFDPADCATVSDPERKAALPAKPAATTSSPYDVTGKTVTQLQADMESGKTNSQQITRAYLDRIAAYNGGPFGLRAIIEVAPDAMEQAKAADEARKAGRKGALLGIPVAVKDLFDAKGMSTTGGSFVFEGYKPEKDAFQVAKFREAGAVILAKANLAEYANDGHFSPSAYGQVWNSFDISKSSIGSSGGSASGLAASLAAITLGSQTGDSLWGPSSGHSLVSLRGSDGMQSDQGVMPLTFMQDYAGVIARSLPDLAASLNVVAVENPADAFTARPGAKRPADWTAALKPDALRGKVIGVPAGVFNDPFGTTATSNAMRASFAAFERAGATVKEIPAFTGAPAGGGFGDRNYEGWKRWIADHPNSPYATAEEIITSRKRLPGFRSASPTYTGTGAMTPTQIQAFKDYRAAYRAAVAAWMDANGVDATVHAGLLSDIHLNDSIQPSFGRIDPQSSAAGVPTVIFPGGVNNHGEPFNLQLQGRDFSDAELLGYAYAFDLVNQGHVETTSTPPLKYEPNGTPQEIVIEKPAPPITTPPAGSPTPVVEGAPPVVKPGVIASVKSRSVKASRAGVFKLKVTCPAGASKPCKVTLTTSRSGKTIGRKTVTISSGASKTVSFRTKGAVKRSLGRGAKLRIGVKLTGLSGTKVAAKTMVTVRGTR